MVRNVSLAADPMVVAETTYAASGEHGASAPRRDRPEVPAPERAPDPAPAASSPLLPVQRRRRSSSLGAVSVLVVEDNDGDAMLLCEQLADAGMHVTRVGRLADAAAALRERRFDFVLSDLHLPDAAGLDCVRELHPLAADAPLIVLTGLDDEELAVQAVQEGAQDYLVKGQVDLGMLRRTLRHARERKHLLDQLVHMTRHDVLTGALNRSALREHVELALARARRLGSRFAVMYIDLDRFKSINDTWGHAAGDTVLREVVARLRGAVRANDVVARLGGDEFAVLLDDFASRTALHELAQRILSCLERPIAIAGGAAIVTGSIGIACYPEAAGSTEDIMTSADTAMYRAKRRGRNTVLVASAPDRSDADSDAMIEELEHALERGELLLHFQPQFAISRTREHLVGFEALLRWQRPGAALVAPSEFIPLLEDTGRIVAVGEWVIERACEQLAAWRAGGRTGLRIAVNLSPRQLEDSALVDWTRRCLRRYDIPARCLELEITESHLMANTQHNGALLAQLRELGVRLAIDDFGTGFSSLAYLNQFAVDCLKIDRSLVEQVEANADGEAITHAIISLGHHLGLEIVAEGVETEGQLASLASANCDLIQGYLFGRPGAAPTFDGSEIWSLVAPEPATTTRIRRLRPST